MTGAMSVSHQEASMKEINTRFLLHARSRKIQVSSLGDTPYGRRRDNFILVTGASTGRGLRARCCRAAGVGR